MLRQQTVRKRHLMPPVRADRTAVSQDQDQMAPTLTAMHRTPLQWTLMSTAVSLTLRRSQTWCLPAGEH